MSVKISTHRPDETPQSYAIEHAEYLARVAERLIEIGNLMAASPDSPENYEADFDDACGSMRSAIHEYRKRALRAGFSEEK